MFSRNGCRFCLCRVMVGFNGALKHRTVSPEFRTSRNPISSSFSVFPLRNPFSNRLPLLCCWSRCHLPPRRSCSWLSLQSSLPRPPFPTISYFFSPSRSRSRSKTHLLFFFKVGWRSPERRKGGCSTEMNQQHWSDFGCFGFFFYYC